MHTRLPKTFLYAFTLTLGIFTGFIAVAWTGPTSTAPNNNVTAPLNVGSTGQAKAGGLELNTGGATNGLIVHGNVGINTTNPSYTLNVASTTWPTVGLLKNGIGTWVLGASDSTNGFGITLNTTNLVTIATNGYVGIGATSPTDRLTIAGTAGNITLGNLAVSSYNSLYLNGQTGTSNYNLLSSNSDLNLYINRPSGKTIYFREGNVDQVSIASGGYVGIGTGSASGKLESDSNGAAVWAGMFNYSNGAPTGGYGIYTYGTTYALEAVGPVYVAGDIYSTAAGTYMSTLAGGNAGHKSGAGYGTSQYGCFLANPFTGACSCPSFAPNAAMITNQNDRTGTWYSGYVCYGS
ncbi:MAG TPA: hypothetical protein VIY48_12840 [Candidatus Paceibacterota bacterium]